MTVMIANVRWWRMARHGPATHTCLFLKRASFSLVPLVVLPLLFTECTAELVYSTSGQSLASMLREEGFLNTSVDDEGDVIVKMNGYRVLFIVERERGASILAKFSIRCKQASIQKVNEFNRGWKYCRAFLDNEGDPVLESDIDIENGVTEATLRHFVVRFSQLMSAFLARVCE